MSQYQPNAAPGRSFIEKINSKFSKLNVSSLQTTERDGNTEDDTLIHRAFVKFFDSRNEPYPEWLGVNDRISSSSSSRNRHSNTRPRGSGNYSPTPAGSSQFQPVKASYNSMNSDQSRSRPVSASQARQGSMPDTDVEERTYTRRSNSRLQAMYNKSRQQSVPGSGYNVSGQQPSSASHRSSSASHTLRDRVMNGTSTSNGGSARATWSK